MKKTIEAILNAHFVNTNRSTEELRECSNFKHEETSYKNYTNCLKALVQKSNVKHILIMEKTILNNDLTVATDKSEISSLEAGIKRIDLAQDSLINVTNYQSFKSLIKTCPEKNIDSRGLPKDGFRTAIRGQIASLQNKTTDHKPEHKRQWYYTRIDALKHAEHIYKAVQHQRMCKFCQENPEHARAVNYMSKPLNQALLKDQIQLKQADMDQNKTPER